MFNNNIFVQRWQIPSDYLEGWDPEREPNNFVVGTHVWDEYPVYEDWIAQFDMDKKRPDMGKLASAHFGKFPVWIDGNMYFNHDYQVVENSYRFDDKVKMYKVDVYCPEKNSIRCAAHPILLKTSI